jgi:CYTH domain-containing protein/predicted ATPase
MKKIEHERRWLVEQLGPLPQAQKIIPMQQGYLDVLSLDKGARIRIENGRDASLTIKTGSGRSRPESTWKLVPLSPDQDPAELIEICTHTIPKVRYVIDGWELDFCQDALKGIVILERELDDPDEPVVLPPWVLKATEVTDSLTSHHLARLATYLRGSAMSAPQLLQLQNIKIKKLVLTGGPGSGKSEAIEKLRLERDDIHFVPEVATILIAQVGILPGRDFISRKRFQQALYRIQRIFERTSAEYAATCGKKAVLFDRGSVDSAAYLDGGLEEFEQFFRTSRDSEYAQYDSVICLDVPPKSIYDKIKENNPARFEDYREAQQLGRRIDTVWGAHPGYTFVHSASSFEEKLAQVRSAINSAL